MLHSFVAFIVGLVESWGYLGIFFMMFLESTFVPFPSEVAMIPAGYLAYQGKMSVYMAWFAGTFGSLVGAMFNYYLCYFFGRSLIEKYGRYVGITPEKMHKFEAFFNKHGEISTFNCRLILGIRQYISLPAGLAKMNFAKFSLFTTLGAGIWVAILIALGYFLGGNEELIKEQLHIITILLFVVIAIISVVYIIILKRRKTNDKKA
ncbi:MAG: DedA family protein [Campylobacter sp.]|nr:DedA family protein [Campylobacter sp.]